MESEMNWPEYHEDAMGCGLEDRNITNRYEAMRHGWDCATEAIAEIVASLERENIELKQRELELLAVIETVKAAYRSVPEWNYKTYCDFADSIEALSNPPAALTELLKKTRKEEAEKVLKEIEATFQNRDSIYSNIHSAKFIQEFAASALLGRMSDE